MAGASDIDREVLMSMERKMETLEHGGASSQALQTYLKKCEEELAEEEHNVRDFWEIGLDSADRGLHSVQESKVSLDETRDIWKSLQNAKTELREGGFPHEMLSTFMRTFDTMIRVSGYRKQIQELSESMTTLQKDLLETETALFVCLEEGGPKETVMSSLWKAHKKIVQIEDERSALTEASADYVSEMIDFAHFDICVRQFLALILPSKDWVGLKHNINNVIRSIVEGGRVQAEKEMNFCVCELLFHTRLDERDVERVTSICRTKTDALRYSESDEETSDHPFCNFCDYYWTAALHDEMVSIYVEVTRKVDGTEPHQYCVDLAVAMLQRVDDLRKRFKQSLRILILQFPDYDLEKKLQKCFSTTIYDVIAFLHTNITRLHEEFDEQDEQSRYAVEHYTLVEQWCTDIGKILAFLSGSCSLTGVIEAEADSEHVLILPSEEQVEKDILNVYVSLCRIIWRRHMVAAVNTVGWGDDENGGNIVDLFEDRWQYCVAKCRVLSGEIKQNALECVIQECCFFFQLLTQRMQWWYYAWLRAQLIPEDWFWEGEEQPNNSYTKVHEFHELLQQKKKQWNKLVVTEGDSEEEGSTEYLRFVEVFYDEGEVIRIGEKLDDMGVTMYCCLGEEEGWDYEKVFLENVWGQVLADVEGIQSLDDETVDENVVEELHKRLEPVLAEYVRVTSVWLQCERYLAKCSDISSLFTPGWHSEDISYKEKKLVEFFPDDIETENISRSDGWSISIWFRWMCVTMIHALFHCPDLGKKSKEDAASSCLSVARSCEVWFDRVKEACEEFGEDFECDRCAPDIILPYKAVQQLAQVLSGDVTPKAFVESYGYAASFSELLRKFGIKLKKVDKDEEDVKEYCTILCWYRLY